MSVLNVDRHVAGFLVGGYGISVSYTDGTIAYFAAYERSSQLESLREYVLRDQQGKVLFRLTRSKKGENESIQIEGSLSQPVAANYWRSATNYFESLDGKHNDTDFVRSAYRIICQNSDRLLAALEKG